MGARDRRAAPGEIYAVRDGKGYTFEIVGEKPGGWRGPTVSRPARGVGHCTVLKRDAAAFELWEAFRRGDYVAAASKTTAFDAIMRGGLEELKADLEARIRDTVRARFGAEIGGGLAEWGKARR